MFEKYRVENASTKVAAFHSLEHAAIFAVALRAREGRKGNNDPGIALDPTRLDRRLVLGEETTVDGLIWLVTHLEYEKKKKAVERCARQAEQHYYVKRV